MLVLHIGTHKTGTSALQNFTTRRIEALRERGVRYLRSGVGKGNAQHNLSWALRGRRGVTMQVWDDLRAELAADPAPIDLISTEALWFTDPQLVREQLKDVKDVRVVMYLRRQDKYIQSLYKQAVAGGRRTDFPTWLSNHTYRGDYISVVRQWADAFGREALWVRPYERGGKTINLIVDFYRALGLDVAEDVAQMKQKVFNPSPRVELLQLIRAFNQLDLDIDRQAFFYAVMQHNMKGYARSGDILDFEACVALMETYADCNRALVEEFYSDPDDPLFPPMERPAAAPEIWSLDDPAYFAMTVDVLATIVEHVRPKQTA
jgi:hypothetical protein